MKVAVVSSNFGAFDTVKSIPDQTIPYDRFLFSEKNITPGFLHNFSNRHKGQHFKMLTHRYITGYDYVIWIDGSIQVKADNFFELLYTWCRGKDIAIFKHPDRSTIQEEADFILSEIEAGNQYLTRRYHGQPFENQIREYSVLFGGKILNQLCACGIFCRKVDQKVNKYFEDWWGEYLIWSNLDQISFPIVMRNANIKYLEPPDSFVDNEFFKIIPHQGDIVHNPVNN